jgi:hypothetical protein
VAAAGGASTQDNSALVEKMMINLRRASENFGRLEMGPGLQGDGAQRQGLADGQREGEELQG